MNHGHERSGQRVLEGRGVPCDRDDAASCVLLARGDAARVGVVGGSEARFILCAGCTPSAAMMSPATVALATSGLARGSLAVWIAVGALGLAALARSRTGRRLLVTTWVGTKALAAMLWARLRGRRDQAPAIL